MNTLRSLKLSATVIAVMVSACANTNQPGELPATVYRINYEADASLPQHIAYLRLMQEIHGTELSAGRSSNLDRVQARLSLGPRQADDFISYVLTAYDEMLESNRAVTNRFLCSGSKTDYDSDETYSALDALDDLKETNLRKQYNRALVDLGPGTSEELNTWLAGIKTGKPHRRFDHEEVFKHSGESVEDVIATTCNVLTAYVMNR